MSAMPFAVFPTRPYPCRESASVFRNKTQLIRTLYSGELKQGGEPIVWPDQLDNDGSLVTDLSNLTIEVEGNNIVAEWAGTINNTSAQKTGDKVFANSHQLTAMLPFKGHTYGFTGYEEGEGSSGLKIDLARPNEKLDVIKKDTFGGNRLAKDENYLYVAGLRIDFNGTRNIFRTGVLVIRELPDGANEYVQLPGSTPVASGIDGLTYYMLGALASPEVPEGQAWNQAELVSDIAVSDKYLYQAYEALGRIDVRDKTNNQLVASFTAPGPHRITLVGNNKLLVSSSASNQVAEYDLGEGLTLTATGRVPAGINEAADLDTSPDGSRFAVLDGNRLNDTRALSYKVYVYDTASMERVFSYGRNESYADDATIYDDKLLPINTKTFEQTPKINSTGFVAWQDNGRLWIGDCGNDDNKLVNIATGQIETRIGWRGYHYACALVANDEQTMLQDYKQLPLDFEIITTQGVTATNGAYRASHNFALFRRAEYDDKYNRLAMPTLDTDTGRTWAVLQHQRPADPNAPVDFHLLLVEKTATQVLYTEQKFPIGYCLNKDMSLTFYESTLNGQVVATGQVGALLTLYRCAKAGYTNGVPQWGPRQAVWSVIVRLEDPITDGGGLVRNIRTDSGKWLTYSTDTTYNKPAGSRGGFWHAGIVAEGGAAFDARFSASTKRGYYQGNFPLDDRYEDANGTHYSGSYSQAVGNALFTGANCEFYKGKAVFRWKGYSDKGLLRTVAGRDNRADDPLEHAPAAYATNSTRGDFAQYKNCIIHVSGDEGAHAGSIVMVYKGFDTIWSQSLPLQPYAIPVEPGEDPLAGLPRQSILENGAGGWDFTDGVQLSTGRLETDGADLLATFQGGNATATRLDQAPQVGPHELRGVLRYTPNSFPKAGELAALERLDTSGRVIWQLGRQENTNDDCPLLFNGQVVGTRSTEAWRPYTYNPTPLLAGVGEDQRPYVEYAGFSRFYADGPLDPDADPLSPGALRLNFQSPGTPQYGIGLYQARLTSLATTPTPTPTRMTYSVPGSPPPADQQVLHTLSPAGLAHYNAGGDVVLYWEEPTGVTGQWIMLRKSGTGGGATGPARDPNAVPVAKALQVIADYQAAQGPFIETDSDYFQKDFTDDFTDPGNEFVYACKIRRPVNPGDPTVWKWGRYLEAGV